MSGIQAAWLVCARGGACKMVQQPAEHPVRARDSNCSSLTAAVVAADASYE